jgi:Xaa-Pro aminopeptidase
MTEKEVEIVFINGILTSGGEKPSFDIIVAAGHNGANPH